MWKVAICSNMRAGSEYETAYYTQILGLARRTFEIASVNVIYDREPTESRAIRAYLESEGIRVHVEVERESGARAFATLNDKVRQWAAIGNQGIELAFAARPDITHIAAVEADLSYPYDVFEALLARRVPIIAPMVYLGNLFYDGWGFRDTSGVRISRVNPTYPSDTHPPIEISSAGSFVIFDADIFRSGIRYRGEDYDDGLLVGVCNDARKLGLKTYIDPTISVLHPVTAWRKQLWQLRSLKIMIKGTVVEDSVIVEGPMLAGPYEEFVRPAVADFIDRRFGNGHRRIFHLVHDVASHMVDVTVELAAA